MKNDKKRQCIDRYLPVIWNDEYGVPTGQVLVYFAEIPGDREGVLEVCSRDEGFQLLGDFLDLKAAEQIMLDKLREVAAAIPLEVRDKWPSEEDRRHVEWCPICGFGYCPRLPKDAEQHALKHSRFLNKQ